MGWFSNPDCPRCGRETTVEANWKNFNYTCLPCRRELAQEAEEKQILKDRITALEEKM